MKWKAFKSSTRRRWQISQRDLNLTWVQKKGRLETCKISWNSQLWKLKGCTSRLTKLKAYRDSLKTHHLGPAPLTVLSSPSLINLIILFSNNSGKLSFQIIKCRTRPSKIWNRTGQGLIWAVQIQNKKVLTPLSNASRSVPSHRKLKYSRLKRQDNFSNRSLAAYRSEVEVLKQP